MVRQKELKLCEYLNRSIKSFLSAHVLLTFYFQNQKKKTYEKPLKRIRNNMFALSGFYFVFNENVNEYFVHLEANRIIIIKSLCNVSDSPDKHKHTHNNNN